MSAQGDFPARPVREFVISATRVALAMSLAATGVLKFLPSSSSADHSLLFPVGVIRAAGIAELLMAVLLASRWWRAALAGVFAFGGAGILILLLAVDSEVRGKACGCFGPIRVEVEAHLMILAAFCLLSAGALNLARTRGVD